MSIDDAEGKSVHRRQLAEGVGFEPTVGCPTLDFESSALNRTQPPFLRCGRKRRTLNVQHRRSNANVIGNWVFGVGRSAFFPTETFAGCPPKNVTILSLSEGSLALHIVRPPDGSRYYLLFARIHRLLPGLFTSID